MGISIGEMLETEFFRDYEVLAGHGGLDKQIQGITVLDAPDGFLWTKGREFVISAGYIFVQNPGLLEEYVKTDYLKNSACLGIKLGRYLKKIPDNILEEFNKHEVPLISIPHEDSWMDIMNAINVTVMNKNIRQFKIDEIRARKFFDESYHARKINKILSAIESEMNFPAMLYDLSGEKVYYSSYRFNNVSGNMDVENFWNPSSSHSKEVLCENLNMSRYRIYDDKYETPFSWITVPITVDNNIKAYFVVIEAMGLIDYFDQFAMRIGFLMIQDLYEQILVAQSVSDTGFEKFINGMLSGKISDREDVINSANELNIDINIKSYVAVMEQTNEELLLAGARDSLKSCMRSTFEPKYSRMALIEDNKCLFLFKEDESFSEDKNIELVRENLKKLKKRLELEIEGVELVFGMSDKADYLYEIKRNYERSKKGISIGKILYPDCDFWRYSQLGAFAWLDIKDDEIEIMLKGMEFLSDYEQNKELANTLKLYLESNMNYSLTAKKLFVHINTVRKRIEEITDMTSLDLDDPMNRLKIEMLLKLFY